MSEPLITVEALLVAREREAACERDGGHVYEVRQGDIHQCTFCGKRSEEDPRRPDRESGLEFAED